MSMSSGVTHTPTKHVIPHMDFSLIVRPASSPPSAAKGTRRMIGPFRIWDVGLPAITVDAKMPETRTCADLGATGSSGKFGKHFKHRPVKQQARGTIRSTHERAITRTFAETLGGRRNSGPEQPPSMANSCLPLLSPMPAETEGHMGYQSTIEDPMESQASLSPVTVGSVVATKSSASTFAFEYQHSSTSSSHSIGVGSQLTEPEFSSYGTEPQELSVFTDSRVSPSEPTPTFTSQPTTPALHLPYDYPVTLKEIIKSTLDDILFIISQTHVRP